MARVEYNVSAKLKRLKKLAHTHFLAGNPVEVVAGITGMSKEMLQEWHDDFLIQTLKGSAPRRVLLRELLLKNAPAMIMNLVELSKNKGDEKLAYSASSAVLAFASRFMNEDAKILQAEQQFKQDTDGDTGFSRTLFDIADPDVSGSTKASEGGALFEKAERGAAGLSPEALAEIDAAIDRLDKKTPTALAEGALNGEKTQTTNGEEYQGDRPAVTDFFDGLEDLG